MAIELSQEQLDFARFLKEDKCRSAVLFGYAGTGKTLITKRIPTILELDEDCVILLSMCTMAGAQAGFKSFYSYLGAGLIESKDSLQSVLSRVGQNHPAMARMRGAKVVVIDNVSQLSSRNFNFLDGVLRSVRINSEPFGGVRLILIGDMFSIPPAFDLNGIDSDELETVEDKLDRSFFFCDQELWHKLNPRPFFFEKIHRTQDLELQRLWIAVGETGLATPGMINLLKSRQLADFDVRRMFASRELNRMCIATSNRRVDSLRAYIMHDRVTKKFVADDSFSLEGKIAPSELKIKLELNTEVEMVQGSVVVMKKNAVVRVQATVDLYVSGRPGESFEVHLRKGDLAVVESFVSLKRMNQGNQAGRTLWGEFHGGDNFMGVCLKTSHGYMHCGIVTERVGDALSGILSRKQFPFEVAPVNTSHKCIGLNLEYIYAAVNENHLFLWGQFYTIITRVSRLVDMVIDHNADVIRMVSRGPHPAVKMLYSELFPRRQFRWRSIGIKRAVTE